MPRVEAALPLLGRAGRSGLGRRAAQRERVSRRGQRALSRRGSECTEVPLGVAMGNTHCCSAESGLAPAASGQNCSERTAPTGDAAAGRGAQHESSPQRPPAAERPTHDEPGTPGTDEEPLFDDSIQGGALDDEPLFGEAAAPASSRPATERPGRKSHAS